jgi:hypothetical protein
MTRDALQPGICLDSLHYTFPAESCHWALNTGMILRPVGVLHGPVVLNQASVQDVLFCRGVVSPLPLQVGNRRLSLLASVESLPSAPVSSIEARTELRLVE